LLPTCGDIIGQKRRFESLLMRSTGICMIIINRSSSHVYANLLIIQWLYYATPSKIKKYWRINSLGIP
jgi:hypothetical protein